MKFILRPIWNYCIGFRNNTYPSILKERVGQYPMKFWCSVLWLYRKTNHEFALVYVDDLTDEEITYEEYLSELKNYQKLKEEWYQKKFLENHSKKQQRILKIHYWLNNIKRVRPE